MTTFRAIYLIICLFIMLGIATIATPQREAFVNKQQRPNITSLQTPQDNVTKITITVDIEPNGSGTLTQELLLHQGNIPKVLRDQYCNGSPPINFNLTLPKEWQPKVVTQSIDPFCKKSLSLSFTSLAVLNKQFNELTNKGYLNFGFSSLVTINNNKTFTLSAQKKPYPIETNRKKKAAVYKFIVNAPNIRTISPDYTTLSQGSAIWSPPDEGVHVMELRTGSKELSDIAMAKIEVTQIENTYKYTVTNSSSGSIVKIFVGYDPDKDPATELSIAPIKTNSTNNSVEGISSPANWKGDLYLVKKSDKFSLEWQVEKTVKEGVITGQSLEGFNVILPKQDALYRTGHWMVVFDNGKKVTGLIKDISQVTQKDLNLPSPGGQVEKVVTFSIKDNLQTNIDINPGDKLDILATGTIFLGGKVFSATRPNGIVDTGGFSIVNSARRGALLARITKGRNEKWIVVSDTNPFVAESAGKLELQVNDKNPQNNTGNFKVSVQVTRAK